MQRINWFPDPNITGTMKPAPVGNGADIDFTTAVNRKWMRVTGIADGDHYGQYTLAGDAIPPAGTYHVHARIHAQNAPASFIVYSNVNSSWKQLLTKPVADGQTLNVDSEITIPEGCSLLLVRIQLGNEVGLIGMMSEILIELADTYDKAVGGASGLLLGGYDATRLRRFVGRVMSDDGHEPMHEPILDHHLASRNVEEYHDRSLQDRDGVFCQCLCGRHRRHYLDAILLWRHQWKPTCQLQSDRRQCRSDVNDVFRRVRQSDRHRDEYAHLHVRRIPGEQDPARRPQLFRRGYDAARLTSWGVMA